MSLLNFQFALS
jgi:hypothetical protein